MTGKFLLVLFCALNENSPGDCAPTRRKLNTIPDSDIRAKREVIEQQHYADYRMNEVMHRNWPEVHQNPKYNCQMFLQKIYQPKRKVDVLSAEIRNVFLNYKQIRDKDDNMVPPKRVTALECKLLKPMRHRPLMYFIRSPQSPKCTLFLNRIGRSYDFYIVEEICEHKKQANFWNYIKTLKDSTSERRTNKSSRYRRQMLALSDEEILVKHTELEQRHYEYCSINTEICTLWPEILIIPEKVCQKFLSRMLSTNQKISLIIESSHKVTLHYLQIRGENNESLDPVIVNSISCQLPQSIQGRRYIHFIRAPSYPSCVFYGIREKIQNTRFYITEEICDTPYHKKSLDRIFCEQISNFKRKIEAYGQDISEKLHSHETFHFQDYSNNKIEYKQWPELEEMSITSYCQILIEIIFSQIEEPYKMETFFAEVKQFRLKYTTLSTHLHKKIPSRRVKALECMMSERLPPNRFRFIRTPKPNKCVYWIRRRRNHSNFYFIVKEICNDDARLGTH